MELLQAALGMAATRPLCSATPPPARLPARLSLSDQHLFQPTSPPAFYLRAWYPWFLSSILQSFKPSAPQPLGSSASGLLEPKVELKLLRLGAPHAPHPSLSEKLSWQLKS